MLYIPFREKLIKMVLSLKQTRDNELVDNPYFSAYGGWLYLYFGTNFKFYSPILKVAIFCTFLII